MSQEKKRRLTHFKTMPQAAVKNRSDRKLYPIELSHLEEVYTYLLKLTNHNLCPAVLTLQRHTDAMALFK